jgi:crotonobetainyl-CoA:carnitine CoA-transferase CaiB-like acyl-CoA transferase
MWAMQMGIVGASVAGFGVPEADTSVEPPKAPMVLNPLVGNYRTADGRWLALCMLQYDVYWKGVLEVVGRPDLIEDPRFADDAQRPFHHADMVEELEKSFATKTLAEWRVALAKQPGQWDVVQHIVELPDDPQARANGFVQDVAYPSGATLPLVASPVQFDRTAPVLRPAPEFAADTDAVLGALGMDQEQILEAKISGGVV